MNKSKITVFEDIGLDMEHHGLMGSITGERNGYRFAIHGCKEGIPSIVTIFGANFIRVFCEPNETGEQFWEKVVATMDFSTKSLMPCGLPLPLQVECHYNNLQFDSRH